MKTYKGKPVVKVFTLGKYKGMRACVIGFHNASYRMSVKTPTGKKIITDKHGFFAPDQIPH